MGKRKVPTDDEVAALRKRMDTAGAAFAKASDKLADAMLARFLDAVSGGPRQSRDIRKAGSFPDFSTRGGPKVHEHVAFFTANSHLPNAKRVQYVALPEHVDQLQAVVEGDGFAFYPDAVRMPHKWGKGD